MDDLMNDSLSYDENDIEDFEDYLHYYGFENEDDDTSYEDDGEEEIQELYF